MLSEESREAIGDRIDHLKAQMESASKALRYARENVEFYETRLAEVEAKMSLLRADLEAK